MGVRATAPFRISGLAYNILLSLLGAKEGEDLLKMVTEALSLLLVYNGRLAEEMETRKNLSKMLHDFILYQKDKLAQTEETLEVIVKIFYLKVLFDNYLTLVVTSLTS